MKAVSLSVLLAFLTSALPVVAQEQTGVPQPFNLRGPARGAAPLAYAATQEAVRLAAVRKPPSFGIENIPQGGAPAASDWSRVRHLAVGTELIVSARDIPRARRYFVAADESQLIVSMRTGEVEHIARSDVAEVAVMAKHIGRHARRGFLIGGVVGAVVMGGVLASSGCGSHGPLKCFGADLMWVAVAAGGAGGDGALVGAIVGSTAPRNPEVIYRAP